MHVGVFTHYALGLSPFAPRIPHVFVKDHFSLLNYQMRVLWIHSVHKE